VHPFISPARILRSAIVLKPSTLLHLHHGLAKRKYRMLFSRKRRRPETPVTKVTAAKARCLYA
jgi:hypothetical protein